MKRFCLALDLKDDPKLIQEYKDWHRRVWPEVVRSLEDSGIKHMEIYLIGNRLFLVMDTNDTFSLEKKAAMDAANPRVQEWETLMWNFQIPTPWTPPGQKWVLTEKVFEMKKSG